METKRRALGTGLEQLFNNQNINFSDIEKEIVDNAKESDIKNIKISDIRPNPYQPRKRFNEEKLQELADSIKEHGLFQPIIVKKSIKGYELVAGERRTRASQLAGLTEIPAIVKDFTDKEMMEVALLENIQREDLNPIEEAEAYSKIMESSNITQDELAKRVSKSRSYITNVLGLVSLPEEIKLLVIDKKLSMAHAKILSKIGDDEYAVRLADKIVSEGISIRSLEKIVSDEKVPKKHKINRTTAPSRTYAIYENVLREKIGARVTISANKITIPFDSDEDLNRILEIINVDMDGE